MLSQWVGSLPGLGLFCRTWGLMRWRWIAAQRLSACQASSPSTPMGSIAVLTWREVRLIKTFHRPWRASWTAESIRLPFWFEATQGPRSGRSRDPRAGCSLLASDWESSRLCRSRKFGGLWALRQWRQWGPKEPPHNCCVCKNMML